MPLNLSSAAPCISRSRRLWALAGCLLIGLSAAPGCSAYRLRGRVIEVKNAPPQVLVVDADDPRLKESGLHPSSVELTIDPATRKPVRVPIARGDERGEFDIPIDQAGAGVLDYQLMVVARSPDHQAAVATIKLPASFRRVLITMPPGRDNYRPERDVLEDSMQVERELRRQ